MGSLAKQLGGQSQVKCFKKGGMVHDDVKQDKTLIKKALKEKGLKCGGKVKK
jgi:hypothetical protein